MNPPGWKNRREIERMQWKAKSDRLPMWKTGSMTHEKILFFLTALCFVCHTFNHPVSLGSFSCDCFVTGSEGSRSMILLHHSLPRIIFALGRQLKWWEPGQCFGFWIISSVLLCQGLYSVTLWLFIRADTLTHSLTHTCTHTHSERQKYSSSECAPDCKALIK